MTDAALSPPGARRAPGMIREGMGSVLPVLTVLLAILAIWYAAAVPMNMQGAVNDAARAGMAVSPEKGAERRAMSGLALALRNPGAVTLAWEQKRPVLPSPHQVAGELWQTVFATKVTSKRSLVYHAWITMSATVLGFVLGTGLGILLAVGIVHNRAMDMSVMPWAIASQTIPILAIAPMIIVVLNSVGVTGLLPKALISAYLSFFPVVVGMVTGLRSPTAMQVDQMATWNASRPQMFWKLRLPASMPFLFTSLKIGAAASLVGAIVGELPTGAQGGLGSRLLTGSYYGQTVQIWSALFMAAFCAAVLVGVIGAVQRVVLARMGFGR